MKQLMVLNILIFSFSVSAGEILSSKNNHKLYMPHYSGTCDSKAGPIYLNESLFIKNKIIKDSNKDGFVLKKIARDKITIEKFDNNGKMFKSFQISVKDAISNSEKNLSDIDISLSFILVNGQLGVYWKETYIHKPYLQGVFDLSNEKIQPLCTGTGGLYLAH